MKLVIAEKPSVGRSIATVIGAETKKDGYIEGNNYIVTWCIGHLVALAAPEAYSEKFAEKWSFENLPIIPDSWLFDISLATAKQYKLIRELMNDNRVDELICATDAGREGECIFRYVYNKIGCKKPFKRLWVSSMEDKAIRDGFENLKPGHDYDNLYSSGLCRSKADWLVGMNATRLFTCRYGTLLSVGRVQTPTLAMIVQRDMDIKSFAKQQYFTVEIDCGNFKASSERIDDEVNAKKIVQICDGKDAVAVDVSKEIKVINPPKLYNLTTLQREANRQYGYTAQQTLDYTQSLYEGKLVTYPRTDSQYLTEDMEETAMNMIDLIYDILPEFKTDDHYTSDVRRCINNKKVSDHHAIICTKEIANKNLSALPGGEQNILKLIAAKLIMATAEPHKHEAVKVIINCENNNFTANGKTIIHNGWKSIESKIKSSLKCLDQEKTSDEKMLPEIAKNQEFKCVSATASEHWTSPPKPYTEDTLLSAMETAGNGEYDENSDIEKKGLGTPATRAAIIETLVKREYISRVKKNILPTEKGITLISVVPDDVKSPKLTAEWETQLQNIEKGQMNEISFMNSIVDFVQKISGKYSSKVENQLFKSAIPSAIGKCPHCGTEVKKGKFGFYCAGKCGMQLAKVYGKELTETQLTNLLGGKEISYTKDGKKTIVLPEAVPYSFNEHSGFQWNTKRAK